MYFPPTPTLPPPAPGNLHTSEIYRAKRKAFKLLTCKMVWVNRTYIKLQKPKIKGPRQSSLLPPALLMGVNVRDVNSAPEPGETLTSH